jgi:hypothetical protein
MENKINNINAAKKREFKINYISSTNAASEVGASKGSGIKFTGASQEPTNNLNSIKDNYNRNKKEKETFDVVSKVRQFFHPDNNYINYKYIIFINKKENATENVASKVIQILADYNLSNINKYINIINKKEKRAHDGVSGMINLYPDYNNYSNTNYINISIDNNAVEDAAVSGMVTELPDEQYLYPEKSEFDSRPQRLHNSFNDNYNVPAITNVYTDPSAEDLDNINAVGKSGNLISTYADSESGSSKRENIKSTDASQKTALIHNFIDDNKINGRKNGQFS